VSSVLCAAGVLLLFFNVFFLVKNIKIRNSAIFYLEDAVALKAYCKAVDTNNFGARGGSSVLIEIAFSYGGDNIKIKSSGRMFLTTKKFEGYHHVFVRYSNSHVNIMYSPKYGEVMILKA